MFSILEKTHEQELLTFKTQIGGKDFNMRLDLTRKTKIDKFMVGEANQKVCKQFLNILLKKLMVDMKFMEIGRLTKFFDKKSL